MDLVRDYLWIGDAQDANCIDNLINKGISAVLNVAFDVNDYSLANDPDLNFYIDALKIDWIKIGLKNDFINDNLMTKLAVNTLSDLVSNGKNVLVHCVEGSNRSAWVIANYLSLTEKRPINEVYDELIKIRPLINY